MIIGSMKEVFLTSARDAYLFDCRVAGMGPDILGGYEEVLSSFIRFTDDIQVKQLTPDHVRMYIANLSDGPNEGEEHDDLVMRQYAVIQTWIHWMYIQKFVNERDGSAVKPPTSTSLIPSRITYSLAHYWKYPLTVEEEFHIISLQKVSSPSRVPDQKRIKGKSIIIFGHLFK